jgi:hypothetical protein
MEKYKYTCNYCSKQYVPKRRKIQKYCSNTCRSKAHFQKNKLSEHIKNKSQLVNQENQPKEKINLVGIGNAAIANVATDALTRLLTHEDNKPATKGDLKKLITQFKNRYEKINNLPMRIDQTTAYFDNEKKEVVYFKMNQF